jgi:hypothetical protein
VPRRTYGSLRAEPDGSLAFRHRPWLVGAARTLNLGPAAAHEVGRGLFFPSLLGPGKGTEPYCVVFWMSPAYRGSEDAVRTALSLAGARDIRWSKGLKSFWRWLSEESSEPRKMAA